MKRRTLKQIAKEIRENAAKAWDGKICHDEFQITANRLWREVDFGETMFVGEHTAANRRVMTVMKYLAV